jgi:hypothetical protein
MLAGAARGEMEAEFDYRGTVGIEE